MVDSIAVSSDALALMVLALFAGCGGVAVESGLGETGAQGMSESSVSGTASGQGGDNDTTGSPTPDVCSPHGGVACIPVPARGVSVSDVRANQGVEIVLHEGGAWIDRNDRNAQLIEGRATLFQVTWEVDDGFEPREIEANLTLQQWGELLVTMRQVRSLEGEVAASLDHDPSTIFHFAVPGEAIVPDASLSIEFLETDPSEADETTGSGGQTTEIVPLGVHGAAMKLRVVIVPVEHDLGPHCEGPPVLDELTVAGLRRSLHMYNPVQDVELSVHDPIAYSSQLDTFNGVLAALAELHDTLDDDVYVYGIVRACDEGPTDLSGHAAAIPEFPPTKGNAWMRTAVGLWGPNQTATFVHELGHTQGRRHVACTGTEPEPDPAYPYDTGNIGVWGWAVEDDMMRWPFMKDYMGYCFTGYRWVSDWGWNQVFAFIEEITSWSAASQPPTREASSALVGFVDADSEVAHWFVAQGTSEGRAPTTERVEIVDRNGTKRQLHTTAGLMGEGGLNLVAVLPPNTEVASLQEITWVRSDRRVDLSGIRGPDHRVRLSLDRVRAHW
jgi:hypothetical protein